MKYKNHNIVKVKNLTTTVKGKIKNVYKIEGEHGKTSTARPWITSIREAKEYINDKIELSNMKYVDTETSYENELMPDTSDYEGEWQPYRSNNRYY